MDFKESKLEVGLMIAAVALVMGFFALFKTLGGSGSRIETRDTVYEMPKPEKSDVYSDFDLSDRDVLRNYIKAQEKMKQAAQKPKPGTPPAAKKKAAEKKTAKKETPAKPQVAVGVVNAETPKTAGPNDNWGGGGQPVVNPPTPTVSPDNTPIDADKKLSIEEWRQLLKTHPTVENMNKFIAAYKKREVESTAFYSLLQEMIVSKKKDQQAIALYALRNVNSSSSFAVVAKNIDAMTPENRAVAETLLLSYGQPQKLQYLAQALKMNDIVIVKQAAAVITAGLENAKKGSGSPVSPDEDPRLARGNPSPASTTPPAQGGLQSYDQFVPFFEGLRNSGDQSLMTLADAFLTTWRS